MKEVSAPGGSLRFAFISGWKARVLAHLVQSCSLVPRPNHSCVPYPVVSQAKPVSFCGIHGTKASWEGPTPEHGFSSLLSYEVEGFSSHVLANLLNLKQNAIKAFTFFLWTLQ